MTTSVFRRPQVLIDLAECADFIARHDRRAAIRCLEAAESCFAELAKSPAAGLSGEFQSRHLAGILRWRIKGFENYLVFDRPRKDGVDNIRVVHGARDIDALFDDPSS